MRKFDSEFESGIKKNVWVKIAAQCNIVLKRKITEKQVESKWKSLKRTYKSVLMNNNTSGQKKRYWEFYDVMNEIMFHKPEITPVATCSSISGLHLNEGK